MTADETASVIAGGLEKILRDVRAHQPPFIASISKAGIVKIVES
jgi:hypothetical protein